MSFNSLQTGKHSESQKEKETAIERKMFQFPSNGKAQRKSRVPVKRQNSPSGFQFPSNGKAQRKPDL